METFGKVIVIVYFAVLLILAFYGSHRYRLAYLYRKYRKAIPKPLRQLDELPRVTIQLPMFNERYVAERLIDAVCRMDYPRELLEIQVLDDSTDDTTEIAAAKVNQWKARGMDVVLIHRTDRTGYKAGALEEGLATAKGEFVAVFDADFLPQADFLQKTVHHFSDPAVGMVQVRWEHINRDFSLLTEAQAILLDGHFVIEHTARNRNGCFFNFNGTAGIWRKETIADAGGWEHDTLTEDMDLSYRAQLKGWRFVYLPDVVSPAELPVEMNAFKTQQHRWAKGSIENAYKMLPTILRRGDLPFKVKFEAFVHLTANFSYPLMVVLGLLLPFSIIVRVGHGWRETLFLDLPAFMLATVSICAFYVLAQQVAVKEGWAKKLIYLPFVLSLGIGLSISNAKAVLEAVFKHKTGFTRTPKYAVTGTKKEERGWKRKRYVGKTDLLPLIELFMGIYFTYSIYLAIDHRLYVSIPFLVLFQLGYLYVGLMSIFQSRGIFKSQTSSSEVDISPQAL